MMKLFGDKVCLNTLAVVILVFCHLHATTCGRLSNVSLELFRMLVSKPNLIRTGVTRTTSEDICSLIIPSLNTLVASSEILQHDSVERARKKLFMDNLYQYEFKFLREPQVWDDRVIVTHEGIRHQTPCTPESAMVRVVTGKEKFPDTIPKLWIQLETGLYAPIHTSQNKGRSVTLSKSLRLLYDLYVDARASQHKPMFNMAMVKSPASNEEEDLCVLEIPSLTNLWNCSPRMRIVFEKPSQLMSRLAGAHFERISPLHSDILWVSHEFFCRMSRCSLEMLFRPSTLSDMIDSNIIRIFEKRETNDVNVCVDGRQKKSPSSTDTQMENYSTFQSWFDLNELPQTPPEDDSIDLNFLPGCLQ